jgi:maleate isomerase
MNESPQTNIALFTVSKTSERPHFQNFKKLIPLNVSVLFESLNLEHKTFWDFEGKLPQILTRTVEVTQKNAVQGMVITGAPVALLNPGLKEKVSQAVRLPVVTALFAATSALRALCARRLMVMTPFDEAMNKMLTAHLQKEGFTVLSVPLFEDRAEGAAAKLNPDEVFSRTESAFKNTPEVEAIYFQAGSLDPIPVLQKLEEKLGVPVIASNPTMLWCILSCLGRKHAIPGYGRLLASWPMITDS